jgi:hypothetical protein
MARRRYGHRHQQIRRALIGDAYGTACLHCGGLMLPGQALDLDHRAGGDGYRGMVHASCNRSEGGRRGNDELRRRRLGAGVFWRA